MVINETFFTLQGEGSYTGVPSIFIRTSGCNLFCKYCDTPYTSWDAEGTIADVYKLADEVISKWPDCYHVVISGGEPLIQKDLPHLVEHLRAKGKFITIETNGTIFKEDVLPHLFSISPKLSNSTPDGITVPKQCKLKGKDTGDLKIKHLAQNNYDNIPDYINCGIDYQVKFVIQGREDLSEIKSFVKEYDIPSDRVFLMPEGISRDVHRSRLPKIAEICKETGYTLCPRLQIEIWDVKRGV